MSPEGSSGGRALPAPPGVRAVAAGARRGALVADTVSRAVLLACAGVSLVLVVLVIIFLAVRAAPVFHDIGISNFLLSTTWAPDAGLGFGTASGSFGALTPILGSVAAVTLSLLLAVPVALAVAIVLAKTNPVIGERVLRPAVEVFVGIPSVVYGYIGFLVLLPLLARFAPPGGNGSGIAAAGVVLAVMIVPTIATLSADALLGLPPTLEEGSYALGATQWQTLRRVLVPAARGGIISGVVLGLARAMGEALAVALVIGDVNRLPNILHDNIRGLFNPSTTMTVAITDGVNNLAINPTGTAARYMLALVLLIICFICISVVRAVNRRGRVVV